MALVTVLNVLGMCLKLWKVRGFVEKSKTTLENRKASPDFIRFLLGILSFKSALQVFDEGKLFHIHLIT